VAKTLADVVVGDGPEALAGEAVERLVRIAEEAVTARGRFTLSLAGGATPRGLYTRLASDRHRARVDWSRTWAFLGDERCVPPTDRESNYRMAHDTLLANVPVPPVQVFRIRGEDPDPTVAAADYERALRRVFDPEPVRMDLILLGMGLDGHTASLFPGSPVLEERERLVAAVDVRAAAVSRRITLTPAVLNSARHILFLVSGAEKARPLADVLKNPASSLPAARIRPKDGSLTWLVDRAAASRIGGDKN
jgi:6-phosphogluconolactonase